VLENELHLGNKINKLANRSEIGINLGHSLHTPETVVKHKWAQANRSSMEPADRQRTHRFKIKKSKIILVSENMLAVSKSNSRGVWYICNPFNSDCR